MIEKGNAMLMQTGVDEQKMTVRTWHTQTCLFD